MKNKIEILFQDLHKFISFKPACFIAIPILSLVKVNAQTFPPGFSQVKIPAIYYPTSMVFAPDGRIFVSEKAGKVKIVKNGVAMSTPFVQVAVLS